ncbi:MAG: HlyD family efflux transporter periplasmic adaptor subunit, partial [Clostridia bacterium]
YRVDGLENVLTPDTFSTLTAKTLEDLNLKTGQIISTSEECGKIIDNFSCYIAVILDSEQANAAQVGDDIKVRLSNSEEIPAEIYYISTEEDGRKLIILKVEKYIQELISYRKISLDVIWWSSSGLKVPNSAIKYENDLAYVVRNRAGYLDKILVKVKKQNDKYAIVDNYDSDELKEMGYTTQQIRSRYSISLYDELIINPDLDKVSE